MIGWSALGVGMTSLATISSYHAEGFPNREIVLLKGVGANRISNLEWLENHFGSHIG